MTHPVAALVAPADLHLGALEVDGAEIVPGRRGLRGLEPHQERRNGEVRFGILLDRTFTHALDGERHGFVVFPLQLHLPHLREDVRDVRRLDGPLPRHEQALVVEEDLLRIGIAHQLDVHRAIAGHEALADHVGGAMLQKPRCGTIFRLTRSASGMGVTGYGSGGRRRRRAGTDRSGAAKVLRRTIVHRWCVRPCRCCLGFAFGGGEG